MASEPVSTTADDQVDAPTQEIPSDANWYVVNTYSGYEGKVKENLEHRIVSMEASDRIFRVIVPTEEVEEVKHGQRRKVDRKMYPGYVLVLMLLDDDSWLVVRNTPGVVNFVGSGNQPTPLPPSIPSPRASKVRTCPSGVFVPPWTNR